MQHRHYLAYDAGLGTLNEGLYHAKSSKSGRKCHEERHTLKKKQAVERNTLVKMEKQHTKDIKIRHRVVQWLTIKKKASAKVIEC